MDDPCGPMWPSYDIAEYKRQVKAMSGTLAMLKRERQRNDIKDDYFWDEHERVCSELVDDTKRFKVKSNYASSCGTFEALCRKWEAHQARKIAERVNKMHYAAREELGESYRGRQKHDQKYGQKKTVGHPDGTITTVLEYPTGDKKELRR